jgi:hypothetical protein
VLLKRCEPSGAAFWDFGVKTPEIRPVRVRRSLLFFRLVLVEILRGLGDALWARGISLLSTHRNG